MNNAAATESAGPEAVNPEEAAGTRQSQQEQRKPCLWLYQQEQMGPQGLRRRQGQQEQKEQQEQ